MKQRSITKLLCLLLVLMMLVASFAACGEPAQPGPGENGNENGGENGGDNGGNGGGNGGEVDVNTEEGKYLPTTKNYGNYSFKMAAPKQDQFGTGHYCHKEGAVDIINSALLERELLMQDVNGVIMELDTTANESGISTKVSSNHTAQTYFMDVIFVSASQSMTMAAAGKVWDLNLLDELSLEASYYDQRIQQDYSLGGRLFQITGDYEILDELVTFGVLYNEFVYNELKYDETEGSVYDLVGEYRWTYSKMMELAHPKTAASSGGNPQDHDWGIVSEGQAVYYFYMGSGLKPLLSVGGEVQVLLEDPTNYENTITVLSELLPFASSDDVLLASDIVTDTTEAKYDIASDIFEENRALFRTTSLSDALYCENMEKDFGILPIPTVLENQREYYSLVEGNAAWPLAIPLYVKNIHTTADIVERLSYYSRYGGDEPLYEAFFERLSLAKICRKDEDREMLTLIFNNKVYDLDTALGGNAMNLKSTIASMANAKKGADGLASTIDPLIEKAGTNISKTFTRLNALCTSQTDRYNGTPIE